MKQNMCVEPVVGHQCFKKRVVKFVQRKRTLLVLSKLLSLTFSALLKLLDKNYHIILKGYSISQNVLEIADVFWLKLAWVSKIPLKVLNLLALRHAYKQIYIYIYIIYIYIIL